MKLFALVVAYKQNVDEIPSVCTLRAARGAQAIHLHIWDNSPTSYIADNRIRADQLRGYFASVTYTGTGENRALSHIYNEVLDDSLGCRNADLAIVLDQDSELAPDFLDHARADIEHADRALLRVPRVVAARSGVVVSPRRQNPYYLFRRYVFKADFERSAPGIYSSKNLFAVASGLMLTRQLWESGIRFEERLRFYGIDTEFCADYSKQNEEFMLSSATIRHDISEENSESWEVKMWRFEQHMDYWKVQLRKHAPLPNFLTDMYVRAYRFAYQLKHRLKRVLNDA